MSLKLETKRLLIQPFEERYLEPYYFGFTEKNAKYQYPDVFASIEDARELVSNFVKEMEQGNMYELVILSKEQEFLGSLEVFGLKEDKAEVGLWLAEHAQGKGYGFEALKAVLTHLDETKKYQFYIYEVDIRNQKSIHLVNHFLYQKAEHVDIVTESGKKLKLDTYLILSPVTVISKSLEVPEMKN